MSFEMYGIATYGGPCPAPTSVSRAAGLVVGEFWIPESRPSGQRHRQPGACLQGGTSPRQELAWRRPTDPQGGRSPPDTNSSPADEPLS